MILGWQFTLREVARRANVSHAAPYRHFPDKASLLLELALRGFDQLSRDMKAAITPRPPSMREELLAAAHAYIAFGEHNPSLYRLMFSSETGDPHVAHLSERAMAALGVLVDMLARGQQSGGFKRQPLPEEGIEFRLQAGARGIDQKGGQLRQRKSASAGEGHRLHPGLLGKGFRAQMRAEGVEDGMGFARSLSFPE